MNIKPALVAIFLAGSFLAGGCVTKTVARFDEAKLGKIETTTLAKEYAMLRRAMHAAQDQGRLAMEMRNDAALIPTPEALAQVEALLVERGLTEKELAAAQKGQIFIGMSLLGLYASQGEPTDENRTITSGGTSIQHVFGKRGPYVYTDNGLVTSWQD